MQLSLPLEGCCKHGWKIKFLFSLLKKKTGVKHVPNNTSPGSTSSHKLSCPFANCQRLMSIQQGLAEVSLWVNSLDRQKRWFHRTDAWKQLIRDSLQDGIVQLMSECMLPHRHTLPPRSVLVHGVLHGRLLTTWFSLLVGWWEAGLLRFPLSNCHISKAPQE